MYKVYCDDFLLCDGKREVLKLFNPKIDLELNKVGSFSFTIYPNHIHFNHLKKLKSIVTVYRENKMVFRGRILNDVQGFYNEKKISCEGELAFLIDTIQRPYVHQGDVSSLFGQFIENHNSQVDELHQFKIGVCTVSDPNDYLPRSDTQYLNTWDSLNKKLIQKLGGYLIVRHEDDGNYIDYLAELDGLITQEIKFGENMLKFEKSIKGDDVVTGVIPLGQQLKDEEGNDTGQRLTIKDVNDGLDYLIDEKAVEQFGRIFVTQTWDDVTDATNLMRKGQEYLANAIQLTASLTLNAVDLSNINKEVGSFELGSNVKVKSKPHGVDSYFLVSKLSLNLLQPQSDKLTLGANYKTFTEQSTNQESNIVEKVTVNVAGEISNTNSTIAETERRLSAQIEATSQSIMTSVSNEFVTKDEALTLEDSINTKFEQTAESFNFSFEETNKKIDESNNQTNAQFEQIQKYIRFENGEIILGESNNDVVLKIENDKMAFYENNVEIAYLKDRKLYVRDGEFINSMKVGKFAFTPMANGSLSFGKVEN